MLRILKKNRDYLRYFFMVSKRYAYNDARCFNGSEVYPCFSDVKRLLLEINSAYEILVMRDCITALQPLKSIEQAP